MKYHAQIGASLIEVLVAILILSFGMLSLGTMLSYSVQAPKLAGYRATAVNLASSHIERIRANPSKSYTLNLTYDGTFGDIDPAECNYPNCTPETLVSMDNAATQRAVRQELPAGGMQVTCEVNNKVTPAVLCSSGNLWIVWQEPSTSAELNSTSVDNCPTDFTPPNPRCLYVRFTI